MCTSWKHIGINSIIVFVSYMLSVSLSQNLDFRACQALRIARSSKEVREDPDLGRTQNLHGQVCALQGKHQEVPSRGWAAGWGRDAQLRALKDGLLAKCRFRRNWYRFRMRPDASGCVRDASGMRRDFEFQQISANSGKIPAYFAAVLKVAKPVAQLDAHSVSSTTK